MKMGFIGVPNEVVLLVISHLEYEYELNALSRTCRWLHGLLNPILYEHSIAQRGGGYTLEWAAVNGSSSTARLILQAGSPSDACGGLSWQPFALAALHGHTMIIELLHEHGVDLCSTSNDWKNHLVDEDVDDWDEGNPLSLAASFGHTSVVKLLLQYGMRPDLPTGARVKRTALHLAAEKGHLDVVRILADAGSPMNAQDNGGCTPLVFAAQEGHLDIVRFLLSRGADPDIPSQFAGTSLCMASRSGNVDIVRCLIDHGATPNPSFPDGQKPLFQLSRAAEGGYSDIVDLLLTRFDYIKSSTEPFQQGILLCVAALTGRTGLLNELLTKQNYDPNLRVTDATIFLPCGYYYKTPETALAWAAERNQCSAIEILLSHGASLYGVSQSDNPLIRAVTRGHEEATATLLAHGANPNNPPGHLLCISAGKPSILSLLLSYNADPSVPNHLDSVLNHVLSSGNAESLRIFLDHPRGPDLVADYIEDRTQCNRSPYSLLRPSLYGGTEMLRLLLERGFVTPPKDLHDRSAATDLFEALKYGGLPLLRMLLDMGYDLHAGDNAGRLIYKAASSESDPDESLDFLLQNGCKIDDRSSTDRTALLLAAGIGELDVMRRLLARGADLLLDRAGETALSVAAGGNHIQAVRLILRAFDERGLSLDKVEGALKHAEKRASEESTLEDDRDDHRPAVVRLLRQFYWRKRYPVAR